jgi:hypothetical protein
MDEGSQEQETENAGGGLERQTYLDERKLLVDAEREAARSFDKAMLTLSAGAFALSITFVREIAPSPGCGCFLFVAWFMFGLAILSTLISFLVSQRAMRRQRDILENAYRTASSVDGQENTPATVTKHLNFLSIVLFGIGLIMMVIFAIQNFPTGGHGEEEKGDGETPKEGSQEEGGQEEGGQEGVAGIRAPQTAFTATSVLFSTEEGQVRDGSGD